MYHLYSTRANGWFTPSSTYSSDQSEAKEFSRDEAITFVRRTRSKSGFNLIPVDADMVKEISSD